MAPGTFFVVLFVCCVFWPRSVCIFYGVFCCCYFPKGLSDIPEWHLTKFSGVFVSAEFTSKLTSSPAAKSVLRVFVSIFCKVFDLEHSFFFFFYFLLLNFKPKHCGFTPVNNAALKKSILKSLASNVLVPFVLAAALMTVVNKIKCRTVRFVYWTALKV